MWSRLWHKLTKAPRPNTRLLLECLESRDVPGAFTPGNLVIYRVGEGDANLVNTGNPVFLDEYTPSGTFVQSIAMPTTASGSNAPLIASGTATSEGLLSLSQDGRYLLATGYGTTLGGTASLAGTLASSVPRVVAVINAAGQIDTTTVLTDFASGNNPRSAESTNGTDLWVAGGAGGVRYTTLGSTTSTQLSTTVLNLRALEIVNDQLYVSTASGSAVRVGTVGTGTPTESGQTISNLPNFSTAGSPNQFFFADLTDTVDGVDTLYVADDMTLAITKYSLVNGNWTSNGTIGSDADDYRGLTGVVNGTTVTLYATRKGGSGATGGGELVRLVDTSGYNGAFTDITPTLLITAAMRTAFRGIALAPQVGTPSVTSATTNEDTMTSSGLVISPSGTTDGTTFYKITDITNGTLFHSDGTTPINNGDFITRAQGAEGLKFEPASNFHGQGSFKIQAAASNANAFLGGSVITAIITVNPVADTPSVLGATTHEDTMTSDGLVLSRNPVDGDEVTHFRITNITGGTLFLNDGTTPVNSGDFITFAQGNAGLRFRPAQDQNNNTGTLRFDVQAATSATGDGLSPTVTATINVTPVNDAPTFELIGNRTVNEDAGLQTVPEFAYNFQPGPDTATDEAGQTPVQYLVSVIGTTGNLMFTQAPAINGFGTLTYRTAPNTNGTATIQVRVMDSGPDTVPNVNISDPRTFTLTVNAVNDPPIVLLAGNVTVMQDSGPFSRANFATFAPGGGSDEAGQTALVYLVTADNPALFSVQPAIGLNRTLTFTPAPGATGTTTVRVRVRDNGGGTDTSAERTFTITLLPRPVPPTPPAMVVGSAAGGTVQVLNVSTRAVTREFQPFGGFAGGVAVAAGDVNGDGRADMVVGTATGTSHVKVFDGATGAEVQSFLAFPGFLGGVRVAAGDVNGDGRADMVVGTATGTSHVKVFDGATGAEVQSFLAFPGFLGGVRVAAGDVNGDGRADVVVVTGPGGNGHIKVFDGVTRAQVQSFLGYVGYAGDINIATGDLNGDGRADIVTTATSPLRGTHVKAFSPAANALITSFFVPDTTIGVGQARNPSNSPGTFQAAHVAAADMTGDGIADVLLGSPRGVIPSTLAIVNGSTQQLVQLLNTFDPLGLGVFVDAISPPRSNHVT